jgi:DNA-directed RNA polymerase specialized sigma24 family protein
LSEPYRITANAAYQKRRRGARRRNKISLDEILPSFHEDGRYVEPIVDWSTELDDPAVQTELRTALLRRSRSCRTTTVP